MDELKKTFAERLKEAMLAAGYDPKPAVLEREFNQRYYGKPIGLHGVRRWLLGEVIPPTDKLRILAQWLNVAPDHLVFGLELPKEIEQRRKDWEVVISYQEREVFEAFLALPPEQKRVVREVILAFAKAYRTST